MCVGVCDCVCVCVGVTVCDCVCTIHLACGFIHVGLFMWACGFTPAGSLLRRLSGPGHPTLLS